MGKRAIGRFLVVEERPQRGGRKTKDWFLESRGGDFLGRIEWYTRWRCYVLEPGDCTVFNAECMRDIAKFLDSVKAERCAT